MYFPLLSNLDAHPLGVLPELLAIQSLQEGGRMFHVSMVMFFSVENKDATIRWDKREAADECPMAFCSCASRKPRPHRHLLPTSHPCCVDNVRAVHVIMVNWPGAFVVYERSRFLTVCCFHSMPEFDE
eukprot:762731-Pyramimonas_sp.AAC.1